MEKTADLMQYRDSSPTSSRSETHSPSSTPSSRNDLARMVAILSKWRIIKGWGARDGGDVVAMAKVFIEVLNRHRVPSEHYDALYSRFIDGRARTMANGGRADDLTPEALVSLWTGQHGLASEVRAAVPQIAAPDCGKCGNTGWETVHAGRYPGVRKCGCGRRPQ